MKAKTIVLFVIGALFIICIPSYEDLSSTLIGIILAVVCFYFGWRSMKKKKTVKKNEQAIVDTPAVDTKSEDATPKESPYEFLRIKLAGVTFKNGRKSRQSILRAIKFRDGEFADGVDLELRQYEWEGQPAYGVYANDQQIGNVPASMVGYISENYERIIGFSAIEVYGGGRNKDGDAISFGCEVVLKLNK